MPAIDPTVQITRAEDLERQLSEARRSAAKSLRQRRMELGVSLRAMQKRVGLSISALSNLEHGRSWETKTARRVARALEKVA